MMGFGQAATNAATPSTSPSTMSIIFASIVFIIFLSMLGLNIFVYLAKGTQEIDVFLTNMTKSVERFLGANLAFVFREFANTFVIGADAAIGTTAAAETSAALVGVGANIIKVGATGSSINLNTGTAGNGAGAVAIATSSSGGGGGGGGGGNGGTTNSNVVGNMAASSIQNSASPTGATATNASTNSPQSTSSSSSISTQTNVRPDNSVSSVQKISSNNKTGSWCFAGENMGVRTCLAIDESQQCMSGDIFPRKDLCINPSLRV